MYWYKLSQEQEEAAWAQANAQAEEYGSEKWDGAAKFVGNLGEIAVRSYFQEFVGETEDNNWTYLNADAIDNSEPEFNEADFSLVDLDVDVKSTVDIRKFNPIHTYESEEDDYGLGISDEGYPGIDVEGDVEVYIFVLLTKPEKPSPEPDAEEAKGWVSTVDHTGNYLAVILGWMFADAFTGEAIGNLTQMHSSFTRLQVRDLYELLL